MKKDIATVEIPLAVYYDLMTTKYRYNTLIGLIVQDKYYGFKSQDNYFFNMDCNDEQWQDLLKLYSGMDTTRSKEN